MHFSTPAPQHDEQLLDLVKDMRLPLENMEFTIQQYLLENGPRLDLETRVLLARLRDSLANIAEKTRDRSPALGERPGRQNAGHAA
ncbi:MAG: hypothetical protein AAGI70_04585 [Pseudomonadota bacterium]